MQRLVEIGLTNAMAACVLAVIVAGITRWVRSPAVRHALWVLVLLKLVTPPLFAVPTGIYFQDDDPAPLPVTPVVVTAPAKFGHRTFDQIPSAFPADDPVSTVVPAASLWTVVRRSVPRVLEVLVWVWGASILFFAVRRLREVVRFARCLRLARPADEELQIEAGYIAHCLAMHRAPRVLLIPGCNNPMLWALGPTVRLLFPSELLQRLTPEARATLLAHELAHYRRGDHWVRLLELVVDCLFWWHPAVWRARQEIEMAEEECCDAWVVSQFPKTPRRYAEALLDAVDFLHETHPPVPSLASGIGDVPFLKRRLTLIMRGTVKPRMSFGMRMVVLGLAATFLPFRPSFAKPAVVARPTASLDFVADQKPVAPRTPRRSKTPRSPRRVRPPQRIEEQPRESVTRRDPVSRGPEFVEPAAATPDVWATIVSPRGSVSLIKNAQSQVSLRDEVTGKLTPLDAGEEIVTVAFSPDGKYFATGGRQRLILWETASQRILATLEETATAVQSLSFTPNGDLLIAGGSDGRVRAWDIEQKAVVGELPGGASAVNSIAVSPDGRLVAVGSGAWRLSASSTFSGRVTLWSLPDLKFVRALDSTEPVGAVGFREAGTIVIGGGWDGRVTLWDVRTGRVESTGTVAKDVISITGFSADSHALSEAVIEVPPVPEESLVVPEAEPQEGGSQRLLQLDWLRLATGELSRPSRSTKPADRP